MAKADKSTAVLAPRPPAASATTLATLMEPADANPMGNVHGGVIMKLVDQAAAAAAIRHSQRICVTVAVDRLEFFGPVHVGDMVTLKASVNYTHRTSMEVGVRIEAETLREGEVRQAGTALLIFVALDDACVPTEVPPIAPQTEEEEIRFRQGELRYRHRKELREKERALRDRGAH
jgi:acyl-CoA hydrolase